MEYINKIIQGDTIEKMKELPDESFDFCFADPPYIREEYRKYKTEKEK